MLGPVLLIQIRIRIHKELRKFRKSDPDPHQIEKSDPYPNQSEKLGAALSQMELWRLNLEPWTV